MHTVEHLFCHCRKLHGARSALIHVVGHTNMKKLMTCDAGAAMEWAIYHFGLQQFEWTKKNVPNRFAIESLPAAV